VLGAEQPLASNVPIGDLTAGMFAAHAILAALFERHRTGRGRDVHVTLNDSLLALMTIQAGRYFATGVPPGKAGHCHPTIAPYGTFATRDGHLNLAIGANVQFTRLCDVLGDPPCLSDRRFADNPGRQEHRQELNQVIEMILQTKDTATWIEAMTAAGVPAGPVLDLGEALDHSLSIGGNSPVNVDHAAGRVGQVAAPWRWEGTALAPRRPPPRLGEHTGEVLSELGLGNPTDGRIKL
jgi:formyl-CoA transferase